MSRCPAKRYRGTLSTSHWSRWGLMAYSLYPMTKEIEYYYGWYPPCTPYCLHGMYAVCMHPTSYTTGYQIPSIWPYAPMGPIGLFLASDLYSSWMS